MENFQSTVYHIWNVFVTSNLFNFVVFVLIFAWIFKKINFKGMLESFQQKVKNIIELAKREKEDAHNKLMQAEKAVENLGEELKGIVSDASKNADVISEKLLAEAQAQIESIEANAKKLIEAEEKLLVANLRRSTSVLSVEVAKAHIEKTLQETPTLQEKYINESIEELDRLNF